MASRYCERSSNSAHSSSEVHSRILQFSCVTSSSKRSLPSSAVNLSLYSILPTVGSGGKENDGAVGTVCKTLDIWWAGIREELLLCDKLAPTKQLPSWSSAIPMRARHTWHSVRFLRGTLRLKSILLMVCKGTGSPTGLGNTPQAHKCNKWGSVTSPTKNTASHESLTKIAMYQRISKGSVLIANKFRTRTSPEKASRSDKWRELSIGLAVATRIEAQETEKIQHLRVINRSFPLFLPGLWVIPSLPPPLLLLVHDFELQYSLQATKHFEKLCYAAVTCQESMISCICVFYLPFSLLHSDWSPWSAWPMEGDLEVGLEAWRLLSAFAPPVIQVAERLIQVGTKNWKKNKTSDMTLLMLVL